LFIKDKFLTYALNILVDNDESIDEPENVEEIENFALKQEEVEPMEIEVKVELIEDMEEAVVEEIEPDLPLVIKDEPSEEIVIENNSELASTNVPRWRVQRTIIVTPSLGHLQKMSILQQREVEMT